MDRGNLYFNPWTPHGGKEHHEPYDMAGQAAPSWGGSGQAQGSGWEACMITAWHIWKARCKSEFEGATPCATRTLEDIQRTLQEQRRPAPNPVGQATQSSRRWEKPTNGAIKINCDASWCPRTHAADIGVLARDGEGTVIGGVNRKTWSKDITTMEALAKVRGTSVLGNSKPLTRLSLQRWREG